MAVKNVGEGPVEAIIEARQEGGPFTGFADLVTRVNLKGLNRRTLESLIAAGALDTIPGNRAQKTAVVESMLEFGHKVQASDDSADLFASDGTQIDRKEPDLPEKAEWSISEMLSREKDMLGFYVSGHPLDRYRLELQVFCGVDSAGVADVKDGREISLGGIISAVKTMNDKRGNRMAFVTLEDFRGTVEMIVFSDCFEKCKAHIRSDNLVMLTGRVSTREGEDPKIIADDIFPLDSLAKRYNCQLVIRLDEEIPKKRIEQISSSFEEYPGDTPVMIETRSNGDVFYIRSRRYKVNPARPLVHKLKELLGDFSVYLHPTKF